MKYDNFPFCKLNKINLKLMLNNKTSIRHLIYLKTTELVRHHYSSILIG